MLYWYLHGWASGPQSQKARYFREKFLQQGLELYVPDLNQPDFYGLTLTKQLQTLGAALPDQSVTLFGSSFGALTALWLAQQHRQVQRLVLIAPALRLVDNLRGHLGESVLEQWQHEGKLAVFHYARQREEWISYEFLVDLIRYPDNGLQRSLPTLILHGTHDEIIPAHHVRAFATARGWIQYQEFDSNHSLAAVQPALWEHTVEFLQLHGGVSAA